MSKRKRSRQFPVDDDTTDSFHAEDWALGPDGPVDQSTPTLAQGSSAARPTRREKRKEAADAMAVCRDLVALSEQKLSKIPLPEDIADEVNTARKIRSNAAKKRQMLYLAKIMRHCDEQEEIAAALQKLSDLDRKGTAEFQRLESWRTRLLEGGSEALALFCAKYNAADADELNRFIQNVHRRTGTHRTGASRALFRELRRIVAESAPPQGSDGD